MNITKAQLETIAKRLCDSRQNVYSIAEDVLGQEVGEEICTLLSEQADLFQCEHCGIWKVRALQTDWNPEMCVDCEDGIDGTL